MDGFEGNRDERALDRSKPETVYRKYLFNKTDAIFPNDENTSLELSPLFNIYIEAALRKWKRACQEINETHLNTLHFADDQTRFGSRCLCF